MRQSTFQCLNCGAENKIKGIQYTNKYCNSVCSGQHLSAKRKQEWLTGNASNIDRATLRKYIAEESGYNCAVCTISEWNGNPITLQVDHIDGDAGNNLPANLRLICPNCHSQTETFGARNKGSGRKSRGLSLR